MKIKFKAIHQNGYVFQNEIYKSFKSKEDIVNGYKKLNNEIKNTNHWEGLLTPVVKVIFNDNGKETIVNL